MLTKTGTFIALILLVDCFIIKSIIHNVHYTFKILIVRSGKSSKKTRIFYGQADRKGGVGGVIDRKHL